MQFSIAKMQTCQVPNHRVRENWARLGLMHNLLALKKTDKQNSAAGDLKEYSKSGKRKGRSQH